MKRATRNIIFTSNTAWSMWNYRKDVLKHFIDSGHTVHILAAYDKTVPALESIGAHYHPLNIDSDSMNPLTILSLTYSFYKIYRKIKPDLVIHYTIKPNIFGTIAAFLASANAWIFITGRGYAFSRPGLMRIAVTSLYKIACKLAQNAFFSTKTILTILSNTISSLPIKPSFSLAKGLTATALNEKQTILKI